MDGVAGTSRERPVVPAPTPEPWGPADPFSASGAAEETGRPLNVFEEAIFVSSRPGQPKVVAFLARTDGTVDEERLRSATASVLGHQPLARARLAPARGRSLRWQFPAVPDVDPLTVVTCRDEADLDRVFEDLCSRRAEPAVSPPMHLRLARMPGGDAIALAAQHIATDGVGALAVLRELILAYGGSAPHEPNRRTSERAEDVPGDADPLPVRRATPAGVARALVALVRARPARIARASARSGPGYGVVRVSLPVGPLAEAARRHGITVNDLLVAALHGAIDRWNRTQGRTARTVRTRLPVDRRPGERRWEVGNITAQAEVTTTPADRETGERLTAAVAAQTRRFKAQPLGGGPAGNLGPLGVLPVRLRIPLQRVAIAVARPYLMPTGELPNVGRLDGSWSLGPDGPTITGLHFATFTGMPQGLSVAAVGYRGRLNLTVGYRWALLDRNAAAEFTRLYREELTALGG